MATKTEAAAAVTKHESLAAALAAFQTEIPSVAKGATATVKTNAGGEYKYQYADLAVITPLAMPLLARHGLAFTAKPTLMGEAFVLQYALMHGDSGQSEEGVYPLPEPVGAKPQEIGSAITYARRYAFCAVTGIAPGGDDDDAAAANEKPAAGRKPRAAAKPQAKPEPAPVAATDYTVPIAAAASVDDLRAIHADAEKAGELGLQFDPAFRSNVEQVAAQHGLDNPPASVTVAGLLNAVRGALVAKPKDVEPTPEPDGHPQAEGRDDATSSWPVAEIPNDGQEELL